ncbi:hypothetical protein AAG570_003439, partial [Ranatra chinensis]
DPDTQKLAQECVKVRELAYCPYSNFKVGAALLSDSGRKIYTGCNVENVAFGPSICAERTAIVKAVSSGETKFKSLAVCAQKSDDSIVTPCGVCRQVISEFSKDRNIQIYCTRPDLTKKIMKTSLLELLPHRF